MNPEQQVEPNPGGSIWTRATAPEVTLVPESQPFIRLLVKDVRRSIDFYARMFECAPPSVDASGEARFELNDPPVTLSLIEDPAALSYEGHMGIQMKEMAHINAKREQFLRAGIDIYVEEEEVACCYSVQNKVWVRDPDENSWEFFLVVEKNIAEGCGDVCACKGCGDFE